MSARQRGKGSEDGDWFAGGLRFSCRRCGACCTGDPGYVWVKEEEIAELARSLNLTAEAFAKQYLRLVRGRVSLKEKPNGDCVFFKRPERLCTVYKIRPTQCRTFPFWPEIMQSEGRWEEAGESCPGIGSGRLWPPEACGRLARETRREARRTARALPASPKQ